MKGPLPLLLGLVSACGAADAAANTSLEGGPSVSATTTSSGAKGPSSATASGAAGSIGSGNAAASGSSAGASSNASGATVGGATGAGTFGAASSSSGGGTFGGTNGGAATASGGASGGSSGGVGGSNGTSLNGSLAFTPEFSGEFYGLLPDGGADLSNVDCRIADGEDLWSECEDGLTLDGGLFPTASKRILDIYVTNALGISLSTGNATVAPESDAAGDGGTFATIELTLLRANNQHDVLQALQGLVTFQATATGMSGVFSASFEVDGGLGTLSGTFGAGYCAPLSGY